MVDDAAITEQVAYYRAIAPEYEDHSIVAPPRAGRGTRLPDRAAQTQRWHDISGDQGAVYGTQTRTVAAGNGLGRDGGCFGSLLLGLLQPDARGNTLKTTTPLDRSDLTIERL